MKKYFPIQKGIFRRTVGHLKAVDGVDLDLERRETLGLVGESGCGKSTLARTIIRAYKPTGGNIFFQPGEEKVDLSKLRDSNLNYARRNMQMILQDPYSSLNPRLTIREIVGEPLIINDLAKGVTLDNRVKELLEQVGLDSKYLKRYPHAFSGGQRQRIGIARALSINPKLVLADEPTSGLDVSVQAQILNLLKKLQRQYSLSYIFISHDLSVIRHIADRIAVMYVGKIVETANNEELFDNPLHPYSEALLSAVPKINPDLDIRRIILGGNVPDPAKLPSGCPFHPRCSYAKEVCVKVVPELRESSDKEHKVACHFAEELNLKGIGKEILVT